MRRAWFRSYLPGWIVTGGGGSGGAATVQTDGVTLQGDGSSGNKIRILQVETQARLTGAGTVASPLDVAGWPIRGFVGARSGTNAFAETANTLSVVYVIIPYPVTFTNIIVYPSTADATHNSDVGLYNTAGTLVANIGATHISGTGQQSFPTLQGTQTIPPALYMFASTSVASTLNLQADPNGGSLGFSLAYGSSSGGVLPNSITPPAVSPNVYARAFTLY